MHGKTRSAGRARLTPSRRPDVITWIDRQRALVARRTPGGTIEVSEFDLPPDDAGQQIALASVAHALADGDRIAVMGAESVRTRLEREYVAISHRPDRLMDVHREGPVSREDLVRLLRDQAG
jgi:hypothetical protein